MAVTPSIKAEGCLVNFVKHLQGHYELFFMNTFFTVSSEVADCIAETGQKTQHPDMKIDLILISGHSKGCICPKAVCCV